MRHVFLVAAEPSGDHLGAALMAALREKGPVRFSGIGGLAMQAAGLTSLFPTDELHVIGVSAVLRQLPQILRRIRQTADAAVAARPDALVIIDSPDFTHRVARRVRKSAPGIPIVDYVCPQVWAWRPWRARRMRRYLDHVLALLPFEPAFLARLDGPPCTYVGHPLMQQLDTLRPNAEEAPRRAAQPPVVLALPGSRASEVRIMAPIFGQALDLANDSVGPLEVIVPTLPSLAPLVEEETARWPLHARIVTDPADRRSAFRIARAALTKSGTVTLELALAGVPMVAAYRVSALEGLLARALVSVDSVVLANLVLGEKIVPELIQAMCAPERIARELMPLLRDTPQRRKQVDAYARLDGIMHTGETEPSARAAEVVLACVKGTAPTT